MEGEEDRTFHAANPRLSVHAMQPKRKAGVLGPGVRFVHPKHGECAVLPNGEWTFAVEDRLTLEAHVYFHVISAKVPESSRSNPDVWDKTKGIFHERSAAVRAHIARPTPTLSSAYAPTAEARLAAFKKPPALADGELALFLVDEPSGFAATLQTASPEAYELAVKAAKKIKKDTRKDAAAVRVTMRALVASIALLVDCARSSLAPRRPHSIDASVPVGSAVTLDVYLDENGARMMESLLSLCGFVSDAKGQVWAPACAGATARFMGAHAHPTGVNSLLRLWTFPVGEMRAWRGDTTPAPSQLATVHDSTDGAVYAAAEAELGAAARDDTGMLPAWLLRRLIEDKWAAGLDARVRAHAEILQPSVRVIIENKTIAAAGGKRLAVGAVARLEFDWNAWVRKSPGDEIAPVFRHHVAAAIEEV